MPHQRLPDWILLTLTHLDITPEVAQFACKFMNEANNLMSQFNCEMTFSASDRDNLANGFQK
jgi:hypothetical protein